jgi:hypothetical protein
LTESVSSFLLDAYRAGGNLLMVAKPRHREAVMRELARTGCFPESCDTGQRLVMLDAGDVLRQLRRNGRIDATAFGRTIRPIVKSLSGSRPLWVYGEIVELCAEEGDIDGALALESLWNDLCAAILFTLLCGYSSAHFAGEDGRQALRDICRAHTHRTASHDDTLGSYLLATA